nr:PREDICTED: cytochrome P450 9e2-like [Megachile rotundata]
MEILLSWSAFSILAITLIAIIFVKCIAAIYWEQTYWKKKGVPYLKSVPPLGSMYLHTFRRLNIVDHSQLLYNLHPDARYVGFMNLMTPSVLIRDPELIRDIAVKHFDHFTDRLQFIREEVDPIFAKNVAILGGERWKEMRNILTPSFTSAKMKFMFGLVSKCARTFVDYLIDNPEYTKMVDAKDAFSRYATDVISSVAFGVSVDSMKDPENEFFMRGNTIMTKIFGHLYKLLLTYVFPRFSKIIGVRLIDSETVNFFHTLVSETVKARIEQGIVRPDMLHLLMQAKNKEDLTTPMTVDDIVSQAFIFFLAGFDAPSNLMAHMVYALAMHPEIQEKLHNEVDRYYEESNGEITYEALMKMEYMDMVISEANRKYNNSVYVDRVCTKTYELPPPAPGCASVTLDPGANVWFPIYSMLHDPRFFPDPEKFDTERFSDKNKDKIVPYSYIPFGVGPRQCIGNRFVLMEIKILMFYFLRKFVVKRNEKTVSNIVYAKGTFALVPEEKLLFTWEKRDV